MIKNLEQPTAFELIDREELDHQFRCLGGFLTTVYDKPVSCIHLYLTLEKSQNLRDIFIDMTNLSWFEIVEILSNKYPILHKSKKIKFEDLVPL